MEHTTQPAKSSPRDVFLYILAVGTLYISVWRYIDLVFEYINKVFPDKAFQDDFYVFDSMRWSISVLFVVFPVYLGITWFLRKDIIKNPEKREMRVRKWLLNFTLFLAAVTIISDLVTLLNFFLQGELTVRFGLKVFTVLFVASAVFGYYFWDLRRETASFSKPSKLLASIVSVVVVATIAGGFFIIGSPATQRKLRFDGQRIGDLQVLQSEVINYWIKKGKLPDKSEDLKDNISGFVPPVDPDTFAAYEYKAKGKLEFELCANFSLASDETRYKGGMMRAPMMYPQSAYPYGDNWNHKDGRVCFERKIDPQLYKVEKSAPMFAPVY